MTWPLSSSLFDLLIDNGHTCHITTFNHRLVCGPSLGNSQLLDSLSSSSSSSSSSVRRVTLYRLWLAVYRFVWLTIHTFSSFPSISAFSFSTSSDNLLLKSSIHAPLVHADWYSSHEPIESSSIMLLWQSTMLPESTIWQ